MDLDEKKIEEAVLALLYLTLDRKTCRAWKTLDYDAMHRLHGKELIHNPAGPAKSVVMTEEGMGMAERMAQKLFGKN